MKYTTALSRKLKITKGLIVTFSVLFIQVFAFGQDTGKQALRLFIIGNSFSQDASSYLPDIAKEKGKSLTIGRAQLGGCSLEQHWKYAEAAEANPDDAKGKPYKGKSLHMLLSEGTWDIVTIQQYSYLSGDLESYSPYAENLYNYIKKLQPNAEIVLHQTWAYRGDAKRFGRVAPGQTAKDDEEMWLKSRSAYHTVAQQLKVRIIPVGDAFRKVSSNPAHRYKKDELFNYENPVYPNLPRQDNSLNMGYYWKNSKDFTFDPNHTNEAGKYLGSLMWYAFLFNDSPKNVKFMPDKVDADFAGYLKKVATKEFQKAN